MTEEIENKITEKMEEIEGYDCAYDDGKESNPKDFEDDCFIHISRGKYRFIFYHGQDEDNGAYTNKDVKRFAKEVDKILNKKKITPQEEKYFVQRGMCEFGGSFVNYLGNALIHADPNNVKRIKTAFPEYWKEYLEKGKQMEKGDM